MDLSIQLRQIDFLRMFKMCQEYGVVKNKRKMAIECATDDAARTACKKLFNSFVEHLFDGFSINAARHTMFIVLPYQTIAQIDLVRKNKHVTTDIVSAYNELTGFRGIFITSFFPHEVRVSFKMETDNYQHESFSKTAKELIEFKKFFEEKVAFIVGGQDRLKELEQLHKIQEEKNKEEQAKQLKLAAEEKEKMKLQNLKDKEEKEKLEKAMREENKKKAQSLFNTALTNLGDRK